MARTRAANAGRQPSELFASIEVFAYRTAPQLVTFLRKHRAHIEHVTGVRYSGELGHPFHVIDDDLVILCLDNPFIPEGRFASLLVRDKELVLQLADGFQKLWSKAMRNLRGSDTPSTRTTVPDEGFCWREGCYVTTDLER